MKVFTEKELEILKPAEKSFYTTINLNYKVATPISLNQLVANMYDAKMGTKTKYQWSCSVCMFNLYKSCGILYFNSKAFWEEEKKAQEQAENNEVEQQPTTPKKRGRKPSKQAKTTK